MDEDRRKWTTLGKVLLCGAAVFMFVLIGFVVWLNLGDPPVRVTVPTPTMPFPNAFDYYVKAGDALVDREKVGFATERGPRPTRPSGSSDPAEKWYSPAEKQALVDSNAVALKTLREGFSYEYWNPPARSFDAMFPHFSKLRGMSKLLVLEAQTKENRGDWGGAVDSYLDALRMGVDVPRGGALIAGLVGMACQAIGRRPAWNVIDHLGAREARSAARQMEGLLARQVSYADVLREEKWSTQAGLKEILNKPGWRRDMAAMMSSTAPWSSGSPPTRQDLLLLVRLAMTSRQGIVDKYSDHIAKLEVNARLPYPRRSSPPVPSDPVSQNLMPVFDRARFGFVRNECQNALLTVALALRAYRLERGRYPDSLSELAPTYLKRIPDDPFAMKGPLRYKRTGDKYVLYSIGPDGKDDGGKAVFDPALPATDERYRETQLTSKGDVVAGVNIR